MVAVNNKTRSRVNVGLIKKVAEKFLKFYNIKDKEVSVGLVGDRVMRNLNEKYHQVGAITDVLAFPGDEPRFLGEIIIDYAQVKRQAKKFSGSVKKELEFVLVHGLLHLLGYEDETDRGRKKMNRLSKEFIKVFKS